MKDGPDIARIAALIGDPARANILSALMDGRALTATELAGEAGVSASTTSIHLGKLHDGGLVRQSKQGRHRYYALVGAEVAEVLEALMGLAHSTGARRVRTGPRDAALRRARVCYDHLAGEMGVALHDALAVRGVIAAGGDDIALTDAGRRVLTGLGIDLARLGKGRRPDCRACLDWSMRRNHLAGALGATLWDHIQKEGWARRRDGARVVDFTPEGQRLMRDVFGAAIEPA